HWRGRVDRILIVDCEETTQVARVRERSGLSADAVRAIIAQQASRQRRRACADAIIYNDAISLADLTQHVGALWQIWVRANP
ncbi:MAG: dephospho-CoA kinase, partial [Burkholderiaceae bacterium]